jgi:hypothetical protein
VHVSVDAARKCETIPRIEDLLGLVSLNLGPKPGDLSILDRNTDVLFGRTTRAFLMMLSKSLSIGGYSLTYWQCPGAHAWFFASSALLRMI